MIDLAKLDADLLRDEGRRVMVYRDSLGNATVGIGHRCSEDEVLAYAYGMSDAEIAATYTADRTEAIKRCVATTPGFADLPEPIARGLINLSFNLGNRLSEFVKMLDAIELANWPEAAEELLNSRAHSEEPARLERIADMWRNVG